jgi:hypothetical protein
MAQFYTLEESAQRLGISVEDFKRRLKLEWTSIRPFRDGSTLRFRSADIDELARTLGAASDPGLQLGPTDSPPAEPAHDSDDFSFTMADSDPEHKSVDVPISLALDAPPLNKSSGDSDVRLDYAGKPVNKPTAESSQPTEEISIDIGGPGSAIIKSTGNSSGKLASGKPGARLAGPESASKIPSPSSSKPGGGSPDSSSEFELSLDSDSDSFELDLPIDSSDEVDLGSLEGPLNRGAQSGINLGKPKDSGVSLEKSGPRTGPIPSGGSKTTDDSDADFELSLDDSPVESSAVQGPKTGPQKPKKKLDSDSEFELTLDDSSSSMESLANQLEAEDENKGDIFETDFELPSIDESGSEVVAMDGEDADNAGFEVDVQDVEVEDDSASQVVLVDDDVEPLIEDEDGVAQVRSARGGADDDGDWKGVHHDDDHHTGPARVETVIQTPTKWGILPALVLFPCLIFLFLGSLMSYEAVRGMWGYHQPAKPGNLIVRGLADTLGMKTND